jgi:hypothetical protein
LEGVKIGRKVTIVKHDAIGEIIPEHYEVRLGKTDTLVFIYKPIACHNYNKLELKSGRTIRVATIDCMLSLFLAFLFTDHDLKYKERLLCISQFLFNVEEKNRLSQKGLLKRFSMNCYGTQDTLETLRAEKTEMFKLLKNKRDSPEYEKWFMKYNPTVKTIEGNEKKTVKTNKTNKTNKTVKTKKVKKKNFFSWL